MNVAELRDMSEELGWGIEIMPAAIQDPVRSIACLVFTRAWDRQEIAIWLALMPWKKVIAADANDGFLLPPGMIDIMSEGEEQPLCDKLAELNQLGSAVLS